MKIRQQLAAIRGRGRWLGVTFLAAVAVVLAPRLFAVAPGNPEIAVGRLPRLVAIDQQHSVAVVVSTGDTTATLIDLSRTVRLGTVAIGPGPRAVAIDSRQGLAYVLSTADPSQCRRPDSIAVIDMRRVRLLRTVPISPCATGIALDAAGHLFVADVPTNRVTIYTARTGAKVRGVVTGDSGESLLLLERDPQSGRLLAILHRAPAPGGAVTGEIALLDPAAMRVLARVGGFPWQTFETDAARGRVFSPPATGGGRIPWVNLATGRHGQAPVSALASDIWYRDDATSAVRVLRPTADGQRSAIIDPLTGRTLALLQTPRVSAVVSHDPVTGRYLVLSSDRQTAGQSQLMVIDGRSGLPVRTLGTVSTRYPVAADWQAGIAIGIAPEPDPSGWWRLPGTNIRIPVPFRAPQPSAGRAILFNGLSDR